MNVATADIPNVVNLSELKSGGFEKGSRFALANRPLGRATGARGIGCSWYEVPPGRTAFPNHYHCANEESVYVLEGSGTLRIGADEVPVGPGDYATFPVGPAHTHQLLNTGDEPAALPVLLDACSPPKSSATRTRGKIGAMGYTATGEPHGADHRPAGQHGGLLRR